MHYETQKTWMGDMSYSTIIGEFYCVVFEQQNNKGFHYRIQRSRHDLEYIVFRSGFQTFSAAENDMKRSCDAMSRGYVVSRFANSLNGY